MSVGLRGGLVLISLEGPHTSVAQRPYTQHTHTVPHTAMATAVASSSGSRARGGGAQGGLERLGTRVCGRTAREARLRPRDGERAHIGEASRAVNRGERRGGAATRGWARTGAAPGAARARAQGSLGVARGRPARGRARPEGPGAQAPVHGGQNTVDAGR